MITEKIKNATLRIGIIGMGYVGLPLAVEFAKKNLQVTGFEIDPKKIKSIRNGKSYIKDVPSALMADLVKKGILHARNNFSCLKIMDVIIICVPTPLRKTKDPDISYIMSSVKEVGSRLRKGQLVILESTTYPGTTREIVLPALTQPRFKVGEDFFLAFSPERVDPGNSAYSIPNTPKVVGGITPRCCAYAADVYRTIVDKVITVSSAETAEMVKLLENTFRAVNIGLVNEVALMCDCLKLNVWEVIDAAASKPFGFMPFYPGPGIGGHCIPLDPHYLSWKLKTLNFYARFIELAADINSKMPEHVVVKVSDALNSKGKSVKDARILILGVSYKKDVSDFRESPALDVIELLLRKEAKVSYHDPYVPRIEIHGKMMKSIRMQKNTLEIYDCVVITTFHSCFNITYIIDHSPLVVDSRNATKGFKNKNIVRL